MTEPVNNQWLDFLQILFEQAVSQGQTNSALRDNRNPREKVLYGIAEIYTNQAKLAILSKLESIEQEAYKKGYEACFNQRHMRQLYEAKPTVIKEELLHE